jgi:uncharacterized protein YuzE
MRIKIDKENDSLYLSLDEKSVAVSEEVKPGVILDFDDEGNVIGFELLGLSTRVPADTLKRLEFETT